MSSSTSTEAFLRLRSHVVPLPIDNVDTDQIIPASYLKVTDRSGLAEGLFANWRYQKKDRSLDPNFILNRPESAGARILLAGDNFGCGSSREHAPWALLENGFRAVLSTRFADIFRNNALRNGLLAAELPADRIAQLFELRDADPTLTIEIDLEQQVVRAPDEEPAPFEIERFAKHCLLQGIDTFGYLLDQQSHVATWEQSNPPRVDTSS